MPRIEVTPESAGEISKLGYLLAPGKRLTHAEVIDQVLGEWKAAKAAELAKAP
ncbi:MAG: hypothetical protein WC343_11990 [Bacilli bacterium]|jgi:hypothetical protein